MPLLSSAETVLAILVVLALILVPSAVRVLQEYERAVMFRLGRVLHVMGPGLVFMIPGVDRMQKVDLRVVTMEVPAQEVITVRPHGRLRWRNDGGMVGRLPERPGYGNG